MVSWKPEYRQLRVGPGAASYLELHQNANPGWIASLGGRALTPARLDGWQQAYIVPAGSGGTVTLTFQPVKFYHVWIILSAAGALLLLLMATVRRRRWRVAEQMDRALPAGHVPHGLPPPAVTTVPGPVTAASGPQAVAQQGTAESAGDAFSVGQVDSVAPLYSAAAWAAYTAGDGGPGDGGPGYGEPANGGAGQGGPGYGEPANGGAGQGESGEGSPGEGTSPGQTRARRALAVLAGARARVSRAPGGPGAQQSAAATASREPGALEPTAAVESGVPGGPQPAAATAPGRHAWRAYLAYLSHLGHPPWLGLLALAGLLAIIGGPLVLAVPVVAVIAYRWPRWLSAIAAAGMIAAGMLTALAAHPALAGTGAFGAPAQACALIALTAALMPVLEGRRAVAT
jgi:hypothetical protein